MEGMIAFFPGDEFEYQIDILNPLCASFTFNKYRATKFDYSGEFWFLVENRQEDN